MITYEYPLHERVRTLLRLEDLYDRVHFFLKHDSPHDHHACLTGIFEILEVGGRADLKSDLLQELDRQRTFLDALRANPAISEEKLDQILGEIDRAFSDLHGLSGRTGQNLRENEWLMAIKQRASIPGGTSEFDLPSYHYWMHRPVDARRADLLGWIRPLDPIHAALAIVLRVLREPTSTPSTSGSWCPKGCRNRGCSSTTSPSTWPSATCERPVQGRAPGGVPGLRGRGRVLPRQSLAAVLFRALPPHRPGGLGRGVLPDTGPGQGAGRGSRWRRSGKKRKGNLTLLRVFLRWINASARIRG